MDPTCKNFGKSSLKNIIYDKIKTKWLQVKQNFMLIIPKCFQKMSSEEECLVRIHTDFDNAYQWTKI